MQKRTIYLLICGGLASAMLAGCQTTVPNVANPSPVEAAQYEATYHAAIATLRDHGFVVERQDYRFGRITTAALDSPTVFEPWRDHNSNRDQVHASTVGHLQRRVSVMFEPTDADDYTVLVEVMLERRQLPLRRLNGTAKRQQIDSLKEVPAEWAEQGITADYDLAVGRDAEYEQRLLYEMLERTASRSNPPSGDGGL